MLRAQLSPAAIAALSFCILGCDGRKSPVDPPSDDPAVIHVATVSVLLSADVQIVGESTQATAVVKGPEGQVLSGRTVVWSSSAEDIATISSAGVIVAVAPGAVSITARVEDRTGSASLTVLPLPVAKVLVLGTTVPLVVPDTVRLISVAMDERGAILTDRVTSWSVEPAAVITLDTTGLATAVGAGVAEVRATVEGVTGQATLTVLEVAAVRIAGAPSSLAVGSSVPLAAFAFGSSDDVLPQIPVEWSALDPSKATIEMDGTVTGVGPGTARLTARARGKADTLYLPVLAEDMAIDTVAFAADVSTTGRAQVLALLSVIDSAPPDGSGQLVVPTGSTVFAVNKEGEVLLLGGGATGEMQLGLRSSALALLMAYLPPAWRPGSSDAEVRQALLAHPAFPALLAALASDLEAGQALGTSPAVANLVSQIVATVGGALGIHAAPPLPAVQPFPAAPLTPIGTIEDTPPGPNYALTNQLFIGRGVQTRLARNQVPLQSLTYVPGRQFDPLRGNLGLVPSPVTVVGADDEVLVTVGPHPQADTENCEAAIGVVVNSLVASLGLFGPLPPTTTLLQTVYADLVPIVPCGSTPSAFFSDLAVALITSPQLVLTLANRIVFAYATNGWNLGLLSRVYQLLFPPLKVIALATDVVQLFASIPFVYDWQSYGATTINLTVCEQAGAFVPCVAEIQVAPQTVSLMPGQTAQLTAVMRDAAGAVVPGLTPQWTSDLPAVVVDQSGMVTVAQNATPGASAQVTAAVFTKAGSATVNVIAQPLTGAVSGSVTSPQRSGLSGIAVSIVGGAATQTGITGAYQFGAMIPVGVQQVVLANLPSGCTDPGARSVLILPSAITTVNFTVVCNVTISGTVTSTQGNPLEGIGVAIESQSTITNASGSYNLTATPSGMTSVTLSGLPANCLTPQPQSVFVPQSGIAQANFIVTCPAQPPPPSNFPIMAVSVQQGFACRAGNTVGNIQCWWNPARPFELAEYYGTPGDRFTNVAVGEFGGGSGRYVCGVTESGALYCRAINVPASGVIQPLSRVSLPGGATAQQVIVTQNAICVLLTTGVVECWGNNAAGQLGDGGLVDRTTPGPIAVPPNVTFVRLEAGRSTPVICALATDSSLYCWGYQQLLTPLGWTGKMATPTRFAPGHAFAQFALDDGYFCGLTNQGAVFCLGRKDTGILGSYTPWADHLVAPEIQSSFVQINVGEPLASVSGGQNGVCGISTSGRWYCWGGLTWFNPVPGAAVVVTPSAAPLPGVTFTQTMAGYDPNFSIGGAFGNSCALSDRGEVWCFSSWYQDANGAPVKTIF